jgi:hypothetical protein
VHYLSTVGFELQAVITRFGQNNAMLVFNRVPVSDLCAYALCSQDRGSDDESKQ